MSTKKQKAHLDKIYQEMFDGPPPTEKELGLARKIGRKKRIKKKD